MKLIMENWRRYLNESTAKTYYWQIPGPWKGESQIEFGVTHVPKARPRGSFERSRPSDVRVEEIFEEVRKNQFPSRPSRLNCVFLCEHLGGMSGPDGEGGGDGSFCSEDGKETYEVTLRGNYNLFKADAEFWTEPVEKYEWGKIDEEGVKEWAEIYWKGDPNYTSFGEIIVSPPESAIIMRKYGEATEKEPTPQEKERLAKAMAAQALKKEPPSAQPEVQPGPDWSQAMGRSIGQKARSFLKGKGFKE
jgi:hypothetical protein